jgi:surface protein
MRARGRHTDETLRDAVALWFDDNAAAVARYGPIGDWDVRDVTDMQELFEGRADFDEDIGRWNVGRVEDMSFMFNGATKFNQPLDKWDVSSVKNMGYMFQYAASFNQPLDKWDVSSVKTMYGMFCGAAAFNQPLERWAVADGTDKTGMFGGAKSFKQPATLTRFGLVLPSPSLVCTDTRAHAAVLRYTRARNAPVARPHAVGPHRRPRKRTTAPPRAHL